MFQLLLCQLILAILCFSGLAQGQEVSSAFCTDLTFEQIPVGNFHQPLSMPMDEMRITQTYNNSWSDGYCLVGDSQPPATSSSCQGQKIYYGHDGLDLHPYSTVAGVNNVRAIQDGVVVASHQSGTFTGWGESVIYATRTNAYSEEILTFHHHHLYRVVSPYQTSREFQACDQVARGAVLAKEGNTPNVPTHLHFTVKRWRNLEHLKKTIAATPSTFYGFGYSFGDDNKIANFLDPQGLLYDYFTEFQDLKADYSQWQWSKSYAQELRYQGWFFGDFDGKFGVEKTVARSEAGRLIKQALELETVKAPYAGQSSYFTDLPTSHPDYLYINTLLNQEVALKVINPENSCTSWGRNFCPDRQVTRAEAVKMVVVGFFQDEFLQVYNKWIWKTAAPLASSILSSFEDVSSYSWYAPYVYFAMQKGLTAGGAIFNPSAPVKRAELAKWLVMAYQLKGGKIGGVCQNVTCLGGYYCDSEAHTCKPIPQCVPSEDSACPLGGGYVNSSSGAGGTTTAPPVSTQPKDPPSTSPPAESTPPSIDPIIQCTAGQIELKLCPDKQVGSYRFCQSSDLWSNWDPPCFSTENGSGGSDSGTGGISGAGGTDNQVGGQTGSGSATASGGYSGQTQDNNCTTVFLLSPAGASCHDNPTKPGTPNLCLETKLGTGSQLSWRLCQQNGYFPKDFTYQLQDQNHFSQNLGGLKNGSSGDTCTIWQKSDFSYLSANGPINGAGLVIEVHSPSGCTSSDCTYYTGITTLYRQCQ